jgi:hypothetical protein
MLRSRHFLAVLALGTIVGGTESRAQAPGANVLQNVFPPSLQQSAGESRSDSTEAALTPDALQGPATPAVMYAVVGMNERQLAQYLVAYRAHMAATWNTRYTVMSSLRMLERAVQNADADAERYYQVVTAQLWKQVSSQDQSFDLALAALLTRPQLQRYRDWRTAWQRGTRVQQHLDVALIKDGSETTKPGQ